MRIALSYHKSIYKETLLAQKFYKGRAKRLVSKVEIGNVKL